MMMIVLSLIGAVPNLPVFFAQAHAWMAVCALELAVCGVLLWFERERSPRRPEPKHPQCQPLPLAA